ncbi:MAG: hypothetical protein IPP72_10060 [Chitinophagaceae bacterium]|nr:hypothetical protein [Chitinophagaceae bacterium]
MNKLKSGLLFFAALFLSGVLKSQTLEEGKKFLYYERHQSATEAFQKLVAADPNNLDAVYWLGQVMILSDDKPDLPGAKALYQKTLMNNSNSALLLAGMGHVELLEGKTQDARARFETALSISQSKNAAVLNAIGFANVNADKGDADYAVEKLKLATTLKNMKDPDVWANLGDAYKKLLQGGPAQTAYETALELVPTYARSSFRIGKIYQSQGRTQEEIYLRYYNDAIAKDTKYAPVYENLYQYYYLTDVNRSAEYLEKYLANADNDPKDCYYRASMKYAQGLFADCIKSSEDCLKGENPYPNLYGLIAYAYDRLGDSVNAKTQFETYFQKQKPEKIGATDWQTYAKILLKFPGNDSIAGLNIDKAAALDSTEKGKVDILKVMSSYYDGQKKYKEAADWYNKIVSVKKDVRKTDLYNAGYNYFRSGEYISSINVFNIYTQKFADDAFGYYMIGKANWAIDSTLEQALANPAFEKTIQVGLTDSIKYKNQLIGSYKYFVVYSVYKKRQGSGPELLR